MLEGLRLTWKTFTPDVVVLHSANTDTTNFYEGRNKPPGFTQ